MGREVFSEKAFRSSKLFAAVAESGGVATDKAEKQAREGLGLHPLVDPKGYDLIRRSISWKEPRDGHYELLRGVAMLIEYLLDTTGSMGNNVNVAFRVLPQLYDMLGKALERYDRQIISAIFGDVSDQIVLCRSQAEMDERAAEQLTYMVPERQGGDAPEDPHYGLFGAAYLTAAEINRYGLKSYHFLVSDAPGRERLAADQLIRIYSEAVWEKVKENGFQIKRSDLPTTREVVAELLKRAHAFFLQVGNGSDTRSFWTKVYGKDRVVVLPSVEYLPHVQAAIVGLTEGTLDLQSVEEFLTGNNLGRETATQIRKAVSGIPIGAQAALPGFDNIPLRGAKFAAKGDLWPIGADGHEPATGGMKPPKKKPGIKWG